MAINEHDIVMVEDDLLSLGDDDRLNIEDLRREIDMQLGTIEEGLNELELLETPGESDVELRKKALDSLARNRAAKEASQRKEAAKQAKQRAQEARQRKQAAKQASGGERQQYQGGHSWGIRMMEKMGTIDIRPMLEMRKRQKELDENEGMRSQMLESAREPNVVIVRNRAWRYVETGTMKRWTLMPGQ